MKSFTQTTVAAQAGIDITPLIDIVFQLLLFFILTSAMLQPALNIDLPDAKSENPAPNADMIISVDGNDSVFINDRAAAMDEVVLLLQSLAAKNPAAVVILNGDRAMRYGKFFEILDIARDAGIRNLNLAYDEEK
jgi:biopolymer transport protein ExbD